MRCPPGPLTATAILAGEPYLNLTLHGLPAPPATLKCSHLADAGLSLIRQLEHRVQSLPELAARLGTERLEVLREAAAAREQLARPFKYARQLVDARRQQQHVDGQISERHHDQQNAEHAAALAAAVVDVDESASPAPVDRGHSRPSLPAAREPPEPDTAEPSAPDPGELDPQAAEALRLARLAQAYPVDQALHAPAAAARPARAAPSTPALRRPGPHR